MTDKQDPFLSEWGWPLSAEECSGSLTNPIWPNIFDEANEMLLASIMIYALADLRILARRGVLPSEDDDKELIHRILTLPVSTREIVRLVSKNRHAIVQEIGQGSTDLYLTAFDSIHEATSRLEVCSITGETRLVSSDVVVCGDLYSSEELVYGIWIDSARRRITVTFRGCTTTKDWAVAAHPFQRNLPNPVDGTKDKTIAVHYGFWAYLNDPSKRTGKTKFEEISLHVNNLLQQYPRYRVYVTGHSLGAALCTLFAFQWSATMRETSLPVTCINFASPMVGNLAFQRSFQALERQGQLRCLRVTNSLDMFTKLPDRASSTYLFPVCLPIGPVQYLGMSCLFFMCFQNRIYRHVGMGLKLYRHGKYKIKFPREPQNSFLLAAQDWKKSLTLPIKMITTLPFSCCGSCLDCGCCCRVEDFGVNHQAVAYLDRLQQLSHELQDKHLQDLYDGM